MLEEVAMCLYLGLGKDQTWTRAREKGSLGVLRSMGCRIKIAYGRP